MSEPKISVIIPVYNAGKYIRECVASVQAQTMSDFELILVNDGSTDNSSALCHEMTETDARIRVIDIENSGPAHARNVGIDAAMGKYLSFIDSDDIVSPEYLEKLLFAAENFCVDIAMCGSITTYPDGSKVNLKSDFRTNEVFDKSNIEKYLLPSYFVPGKSGGISCLWNKLYRRELLQDKGIRLDEKRVRAEDWLFNLQCLLAYPRFVVIDDILYNYIIHPGSVMHTMRHGEWWQSFESMNILLDVNERIGGNYQSDIALTCLQSVLEFAIQLHRNKMYVELDELLHSAQMRDTLNRLSTGKILTLSRAFATIGVLMKLRLYAAAKAVINHL